MDVEGYISIYEWEEESNKYNKNILKEPLFQVTPNFDNLIIFLESVSSEEGELNEEGIGELEIDFGLFMECFEDYRWNQEECETIIKLIKIHQENIGNNEEKYLGLKFQKTEEEKEGEL